MPTDNDDFRTAADNDSAGSILAEIFGFMHSNKKWWLAPIVIMLLFIGTLLFLSTTAVAPFIYTLF